MNCPKCGAFNIDLAGFCNSCGASLADVQKKSVWPVIVIIVVLILFVAILSYLYLGQP